MSRLKVGCIGTGFIAGRHLAALATMDEVDVVAVADADLPRAERAAAAISARSYDDGQSLLSTEELDAVWLCVPPFVHGALECAALDRGLPMFVEKPLAVDNETAEGIGRRVEGAGVPTAVGYHWRYLSGVESARAFLQDRPPAVVSGWWLDATPAAPWWVDRSRSGGQVVEQTTHLLDLARHLVGEVAAVQAIEVPSYEPDRAGAALAPAASSATLRFRSGAIGTVTSARFLPGRHRVAVELLGEEFALELSERSLSDHGCRTSTPGGTRVETSTEDPIRREDRAFVDVLLGRGDDVRSPYAEALRSHRLACAVDRSAREGGTWVTVGENGG